MRRSRFFRPRLAVAIGVALAVSAAGAQAMAAPLSAPVSAPKAAALTAGEVGTQTVVPYPAGRQELAGVGATGFLTQKGEWDGQVVWTRFADGTSTTLAKQWAATGGKASDLVLVRRSDGTVEVHDMAANTPVTVVDPRTVGGYVLGAAGRTVVVRAPNATGGQDVHLSGGVDGEQTTRKVTGLPTDMTDPVLWAGTPDHALLAYVTPRGRQWALIDLATAAVGQVHAMNSAPTSLAVSGTHVAWGETDATGAGWAVVAPRGSGGADLRIRLGGSSSAETPVVGLAGDWVTYGLKDGLEAQRPDPMYGLTARNLTTGATGKVLDQVLQTATAPDGTLYASGGTVAGGGGLYRIAPGADGVPAATLVASSGESTKVALLGTKIPDVVDLDATGGRFRLEWTVSRNNVALTVTLRSTRTGETYRQTVYPLALDGYDDTHRAYLDWQGGVVWNAQAGTYTGAPSGPYTWQIDARPLNGVGPDLTASGSFTVARTPGLHDYDVDGYPDILSRDLSGGLWIGDTYTEYGTVRQNVSRLVGSGWDIYDRIEASGDLGGGPVSDLVARDRAGVLWLYRGTGNGKTPFASRVRVGAGWNTYAQLTGGSDLNGDGRADLLATDRTGALWLYPGTGDYQAPFAARVKIGSGGWGGYNQIVATGDIAGGSAGDLVARDASGVLWLYAGRGDGTLAARVRIGGGWNTYRHFVGAGDGDRDGRPDLYATDLYEDGHGAWLYPSTGSASRPFTPRIRVGVTFTSSRFYDLFI